MKRLFLILVIFFSMTSFKHQKTKLTGTWKEYWATGNLSDIEDNDIYEIKIIDGNLSITCRAKNYFVAKKIVYDNEELTFDLHNTDSDLHIPYTLKLKPNGKWLTGKAISVKGVEKNVKWERLN